MLKDNSKVAVITVFKNSTFSFLYNIRKTTPSKFSHSSHFNVSNFQLNTKVAIKMQIYLQNFKFKKRNKSNQQYLFKLVDYKMLRFSSFLSLKKDGRGQTSEL